MKKARVALAAAVAAVALNGFAVTPAHAMTILHCYIQHDQDKCDAHGKPDDGKGTQPVNVPEPGTMALLATGLAAAGFGAWRSRRKKA